MRAATPAQLSSVTAVAAVAQSSPDARILFRTAVTGKSGWTFLELLTKSHALPCASDSGQYDAVTSGRWSLPTT